MDQPVTICGTFHVGEVRENGDFIGIYITVWIASVSSFPRTKNNEDLNEPSL